MDPSTARQFDIFAQMVASGDIVLCARDLKLPLETVEAELHALEERLGYPLFTHSFGTVSLTPAGRKAVSALELLSTHASDDWQNAQPVDDTALPDPESAPEIEDVEQLGAPDTGSTDVAIPERAKFARPLAAAPPPDAPVQNIILASHPTIFAHFQDALTAFETTSPDIGITLRLEGLTSGQVQPLFDAELADIAYFYALEAPDDFASRYAWSERISLFIASSHPLTREGAVLAEDLADIPYLALGRDNLIRQLSEAALARTGLLCGEPIAELDNLYEIMMMVQRGQGYFAAFGPMARDFGKMKNVHRIPYAQALAQVEVRQAIRPGKTRDPAISALAEYLFR